MQGSFPNGRIMRAWELDLIEALNGIVPGPKNELELACVGFASDPWFIWSPPWHVSLAEVFVVCSLH